MKRILQTMLVFAAAVFFTVSAPAFAGTGHRDTATHVAEKRGAQATHPLNINRASASELSAGLSGIGPAKASAIVAYRKAHGSFKSVNDLARVKGIGEATIAKNRNRLSIR